MGNSAKYKVVDEDHPRFDQVGVYDRRWIIPGSSPDLYCYTITFEDGKTEQFLAYQIDALAQLTQQTQKEPS